MFLRPKESAVVIRLQGGLGNQLFQYATAYAVASRLGVNLLIDSSAYPDINNRQYALSNFTISGKLIKKTGYIGFKWLQFFRISRKRNQNYFLEKHFNFDPQILEIIAPVYLDGYWQSYRYFSHCRELLLEEFKANVSLSLQNQELIKQIKSTESVAIHVRRGDYVSNLATNTYHGLCSLAYYEAAVVLLNAELADLKFFIFTDDPAWVKDQFRVKLIANAVCISNPFNPIEDFLLMAACKHFIIANSSFSWWGAWLSGYKGKRVIAPYNWFMDSNINTSDLIPESWIRL